MISELSPEEREETRARVANQIDYLNRQLERELPPEKRAELTERLRLKRQALAKLGDPLTAEEREELAAHLNHEIHELDCRIERERNPSFKAALAEVRETWRSIIVKLGGELR